MKKICVFAMLCVLTMTMFLEPSFAGTYKVNDGGDVYKRQLLYHGCIPMTDEGEFEEVEINGSRYKGKGLMDYLDDQVRKAYFSPSEAKELSLIHI